MNEAERLRREYGADHVTVTPHGAEAFFGPPIAPPNPDYQIDWDEIARTNRKMAISLAVCLIGAGLLLVFGLISSLLGYG